MTRHDHYELLIMRCNVYFKVEKGEKEETTGNKKIQIRLPVVRHTERHKAKQQVNNYSGTRNTGN